MNSLAEIRITIAFNFLCSPNLKKKLGEREKKTLNEIWDADLKVQGSILILQRFHVRFISNKKLNVIAGLLKSLIFITNNFGPRKLLNRDQKQRFYRKVV